jgi:hypothetical protein
MQTKFHDRFSQIASQTAITAAENSHLFQIHDPSNLILLNSQDNNVIFSGKNQVNLYKSQKTAPEFALQSAWAYAVARWLEGRKNVIPFSKNAFHHFFENLAPARNSEPYLPKV